MSRSKSRFNLLHLGEFEHYVNDYSAFYYPPHVGNRQSSFEKKKVKGRLILCSKSIIFDPENFRYPIVKLIFKHALSIKKGGQQLFEKEECFSLATKVSVELMKNNVVGQYKVKKVRGTHTFTLLYSSLNKFLVLLKKLFDNSKLPYSEAHETQAKLIKKIQSEIKFDKSWIEDLSEKPLLECFAYHVTPLVKNPGRIMLTNQQLYFQPFSKTSGVFVQKFSYEKVSSVHKRRHMLAQLGLELFMKDKTSIYLAFKSPKHRDTVYETLMSQNILKKLETNNQSNMTLKWKNRLISNFEYLQYLNSQADRTKNDITQYPVYPWIIADYKSKKLDFTKKKTFRDLTKPIGALNEERLNKLKERFVQMPEPKFLYGTHYSTPAFVLYYLVRSNPQCILRLHNGKFDDPNRMFHEIKETWEGVNTHQTDVKELIPEFYEGNGDFCINKMDLNLGARPNGEKIHDIILPPWANKDIKQFIKINREALESDYVSENLHHWIDLIFGYKQRGEEAIKANNLFYYLTYEGSVDMYTLKNYPEKIRSIEAQITEFGQCPIQLFTTPHTQRLTRQQAEKQNKSLQSVMIKFGGSDFKKRIKKQNKKGNNLGDDSDSDSESEKIGKLTELRFDYTYKPHRDSITSVCLSSNAQTIYSVSQDSTLKVYSLEKKKQLRSISLGNLNLSSCALTPNEKTVIVGSWDNSVYLYSTDFGRITDKFAVHDDAVSCMCVKKNKILTGSWDAGVKFWELERNQKNLNKIALGDFIENESEVKSIDLDAQLKYAVCGSEDGSITIWDIRTMVHLKTFEYVHDGPITSIQFTRGNEWIVSCSEDCTIKVHDLSGGELLKLDTNDPLCSLVTDGIVLISGNENGLLQMWDLTSGKFLKNLPQKHKSSINSIYMAKNKKTIITAADEICVWKC
ncbi:protein fan [Anaeramoeba flamelloides]|uniref:Protein fan n=1 Tax=Anaeramoeba flamelloides TaxID=1746091 RepID=A0ABQ8X0A7_9EUKA|nr:protein fan [Anaeramoeba flamelloides]